MQSHTPPPGAEVRRRLAWYQKLLLWGAWLGALIGPPAWFVAETFRDQSRMASPVPLFAAGPALLFAVFLTVVVRKAPAGPLGIDITSAEGLRGRFVKRSPIYRFFVFLYVLVNIVVALMFRDMQARGITFDPSLWALAPLMLLSVLIAPRLFMGVQSFRIDDGGRLWVRRAGRDRPLDLARCAEIRLRIHSGSGGKQGTSVITCRDPDLGKVKFVLNAWHSEEYGSAVDPWLISDWFAGRVSQLGVQLQPVGPDGRQGWVAAPGQ